MAQTLLVITYIKHFLQHNLVQVYACIYAYLKIIYENYSDIFCSTYLSVKCLCQPTNGLWSTVWKIWISSNLLLSPSTTGAPQGHRGVGDYSSLKKLGVLACSKEVGALAHSHPAPSRAHPSFQLWWPVFHLEHNRGSRHWLNK